MTPHSYRPLAAAIVCFPGRLAKARERAGLSQPQLASRLGASLRAVQGWEAGHREPALSTAVRLAQTLGVSLLWLAGLED